MAFICPFERMKVRAMTLQQIAGAPVGSYRLWAGFRPIFAKQASISLTFNMTYGVVMSATESYQQHLPKTVYLTGVSAFTGMVCAAVTTPVDMVKDQMQMEGGLKDKRFFPTLKEVYQRHGFYNTMRAMPVKMARSAWYFAATTAFMSQAGALPSFMQPKETQQDDPQASARPKR